MSALEQNVLALPHPELIPDTEVEGFLQAEQLTDVPDGSDLNALDVWIDRRLEVIANIEDKVLRNFEVAARRVHMIEDERDSMNAVLKRQSTYLRSVLVMVARAYPYKGGKSRQLFFGTIGKKQKPEHLEIHDSKLALAFAKEHVPDAVKVEYSVLKKPLLQFIKDKGMEPDGCELVPAVDEPYVNVKGVGNA